MSVRGYAWLTVFTACLVIWAALIYGMVALIA